MYPFSWSFQHRNFFESRWETIIWNFTKTKGFLTDILDSKCLQKFSFSFLSRMKEVSVLTHTLELNGHLNYVTQHMFTFKLIKIRFNVHTTHWRVTKITHMYEERGTKHRKMFLTSDSREWQFSSNQRKITELNLSLFSRVFWVCNGMFRPTNDPGRNSIS